MRKFIVSLLGILLNINVFCGVFSNIKIDTTTKRVEKNISGIYYFGPSTSTYKVKIDGITGEIQCSTINANIDISNLVIDTMTTNVIYTQDIDVNNLLILPTGDILSSTKTIVDYQPNFAKDSDKLDGKDSLEFGILKETQSWSGINDFKKVNINEISSNNLEILFDKKINMNLNSVISISSMVFSDGTIMTSTSTFGNIKQEVDPVFVSSAPLTYLFKNEKVNDSDRLDGFDSLYFASTQTTKINDLTVSTLTFSDGTILTSTTSLENLAADNLGNHIATQNLDLNGFDLINTDKILIDNETTNFFKLEKNLTYRGFRFDLQGHDYIYNFYDKGQIKLEPFYNYKNSEIAIALNIKSFTDKQSMLGLFKDTNTLVGYISGKYDSVSGKDSLEIGAKQVIFNMENDKIYLDTDTFKIARILDLQNSPIINIDWSSSDDGSGSGLDADTLDGIDSSSFILLNGTQTFTGENYFNNKIVVSTLTFSDDTIMTSTTTFLGKNEKASDSDKLDGYHYDAFVSTEGDTMSGNLNMDGNNIINTGEINMIGNIDLNGYRVIDSSTIAYSTVTYSHDLINMEFFHKYRTQAIIVKGSSTVSTSSTTYVELGLRYNDVNYYPQTKIYGLKLNLETSGVNTTVKFQLRKSTSSDFSNETLILQGTRFLTKANTPYEFYTQGSEIINNGELNKTYYYRVLWQTDSNLITNKSYSEIDIARKLFILIFPYQKQEFWEQ